MDVELPDGTVVEGVPDGLSQRDLVSMLEKNGHDTSWYKGNQPSGLIGGVASAVGGGIQNVGRATRATFNAYTGDNADIESVAASQKAADETKPLELRQFMSDYAQRIAKSKGSDDDVGVLDAIGDFASAAWNNKTGFVQSMAEQLPNAAPVLAAGLGGAKAGALAGGALTLNPIGAAAGGIAGAFAGMFLGNTVLETGFKSMEKAEGGLTDAERGQAISEGATKGAVIAGVDLATLGLGGKAMKMLGGTAVKAGAMAEAKVLMDAGVDVTNKSAMAAALAGDVALRESARAAGDAAAKTALSTGRKAAMAGTGMGLETVGEGVGEFTGELAATGKGNVADAVMESFMGAGQSAVETAYNFNKAQGNNLSASGMQENAPPAPATPPGLIDTPPQQTILETVQAITSQPDVDGAIAASQAQLDAEFESLRKQEEIDLAHTRMQLTLQRALQRKPEPAAGPVAQEIPETQNGEDAYERDAAQRQDAARQEALQVTPPITAAPELKPVPPFRASPVPVAAAPIPATPLPESGAPGTAIQAEAQPAATTPNIDAYLKQNAAGKWQLSRPVELSVKDTVIAEMNRRNQEGNANAAQAEASPQSQMPAVPEEARQGAPLPEQVANGTTNQVDALPPDSQQRPVVDRQNLPVPEESANQAAGVSVPAVAGEGSNRGAVKVEDELRETRNPPEVSAPIAIRNVKFETTTLNGPKTVSAKLYELPGYKGPQLAVATYKSRTGQGYRVYLPKSGMLLQDNNGVGDLAGTLKTAVQRINQAKLRLAAGKPAVAPTVAPVPEASRPNPVAEKPQALPPSERSDAGVATGQGGAAPAKSATWQDMLNQPTKAKQEKAEETGERAYTESAANRTAARLTQDGFPTVAVPHPTKPGMWALMSKEEAASQSVLADPVAEAKKVLDAAGVTGRERTATIAEVRRGDLTAEDVAEAHPKVVSEGGKQPVATQGKETPASLPSEAAKEREGTTTVKESLTTAPSATLPKTPSQEKESGGPLLGDVDKVGTSTPAFKAVDTESAAFREWFKDSKVVDADGKPLRVYHGTATDKEFSKFKPQRGGFSEGFGYWFASDPSATDAFSRPGFTGTSSRTIPVFLSINSPMVFNGWEDYTAAVSKFQKVPGFEGIAKAHKSLRRSLLAQGHDGAVIRGSDSDTGVTRDDWIAFNPEQIKSATSNTGAFDPTNPSILESRSESPWDGLSVINDPSEQESSEVQSGIEGKTPSQAAKFIAENAPNESHRLIADRVAKRLRQMQLHGKKFILHVTHLGDQIPETMAGAGIRAQVIQKPNDPETHIWIQGADATGKVGVSYETVLHELLHAATQKAIDLGQYGAKGEIGAAVQDLFAVYRHVLENIAAKDKRGEALNWYEDHFLAGRNNTLANMHELVSWAMTNKPTQDYLESIPYKNTTLWGRFVEAIRTFLGLSPKSDTALSEVIGITDKLMNIDAADLMLESMRQGQPMSMNLPHRMLVNSTQGMEARAPTFYSQLARAIDSAPDKIFGPAQQVKLWLLSNAGKLGVKKEEMQTAGITDWLDLRGKEKTSKADVAEFLNGNGVSVQEVTLANPETNAWMVMRKDEEEDEALYELKFASQAEARRWIRDQPNADEYRSFKTDISLTENETKFSGYVPPGGKPGSYRELLLTLPGAGTTTQEAREFADIQGRIIDGRDRPGDEDRLSQLKAKGVGFRSTHFDQPNIIAHLRVDEVSGANGERLLRVIEAQSDWGQEGRKKGFRDEKLKRELDAKVARGESLTTDEIDAYNVRINDAVTPGAPFVTDTQAWLSLAIKKAIHYSVEQGYDGIVFATGKQQFDQWGSQEIAWVKDGDGWRINATEQVGGNAGGIDLEGEARARGILKENRGKRITNKEELLPIIQSVMRDGEGERAEVIADKVWKRMQDESAGTSLPRKEGMEAFYDRIVPQTTDKVLKQIGADAKIGEIMLGTSDRFTASKVGGEWRVIENGMPYGPAVDSEQSAQAVADRKNMKFEGAGMRHRGFLLTDSIREKSMQGLPLFAKGEARITGETPTSIRSALASAFGEVTVRNLERKNLLTISASVDDLPRPFNIGIGPTTAAIFDGADRAYLIANRITTENASKLLLHELGVHFGLERMLGSEGYKALTKRVRNLERIGHKRIHQAYEEVRSKYIKLDPETGRPLLDANGNTLQEFSEDSDRFMQEVLANIGEDADIQKLGWWRNIVLAVRRFLTQLGYELKLSDKDIQDMIVISLRKAAQEDRVSAGAMASKVGGGGTAFKAVDTESAAFKAWSSGAPIKSEGFKTGEAVTVKGFHGSKSDITEFSGEKRGDTTKAPSAKEGFFFGSNPNTADAYTYFAASNANKAERKMQAELNRKRGAISALKTNLQKIIDSAEMVDVGFYDDAGEFHYDYEFEDKSVKDRILKAKENIEQKEAEIQLLVVKRDEYILDYMKTAYGHSGPLTSQTYSAFLSDIEGRVIYPVYVAMNNPLVFDFEGKSYRTKTFKDLLRTAKEQGHDGAIFTNVHDSGYEEDGDNLTPAFGNVFVAFRPEQIKSAVSNSGQFSATNPNILEARTVITDDNNRQPTLTEKAIELAGSFSGPSVKSLGSLNNVMTQLHKARRDPKHFGPVFNLAMAFRTDLSRSAYRSWEMAKDILPAYDDIRGAVKTLIQGRKGQKEIVRAASMLFEGTTYGGGNPLAGMRWTHQQLKDKYKATDKEIELYDQARAAIDSSLTEVSNSIAWKLAKPHLVRWFKSQGDAGQVAAVKAAVIGSPQGARGDMLAILEKVRAESESGFQDAEKSLIESMRSGNVDKYAMKDAESDLNEGLSIEDTIKAINKLYEQAGNLKDAGYTPLSRFGRYTVDVFETGPDGKIKKDANGVAARLEFKKFDFEAEAKMEEKRLKQQYAGRSDVAIERGIQNDEALFAGVDPDTVALFVDQVAEIPGLDVKREVLDEWRREAVSQRSAITHSIKRKGIAGYSEDLPRVLATFLTSNARYASANFHMADMLKAVNEIPKSMGDVQKDAKQLYDYINANHEPGAWMRGLMFAWYLGGSPAAAAVNMTQPVLMTLPYLQQFGNASKHLLSSVRQAIQPGLIPTNLRLPLNRAMEEGIVEAQEIHHLYAEGMKPIIAKLPGGEGLRARAQSAATLWGAFFGMAENFNRRLSFLSAYKMAQDMGTEKLKASGFDSPYSFARRAVEETQGVYAKENRPNWARGTGIFGAVGVAAFTFKQYSIQYVELLNRMWKSGPEGKKAASLMLGLLILASGIQGAPGADDLDDLIDTIMQSLGYRGNIKKAKRDALRALAGERMADIVMYGLSAETPIDVQSRLGLGNIIPSTGVFKPSEKNKASQFAEILGPPGGMARSVGDFIDATQSGQRGSAFAALSPVFVRNVAKAYQMLETGEYKDTRGRKVEDVDAVDAAIKGFGFQPQSVASASRKAQMVRQDIAQVKEVESDIAAIWAQGMAEKNPDEVRRAREMLKDWNAKNPETPIRINLSQILRRVGELRKERSTRLEKTAPKELRRYAREGLN